MRLYDVAVCDFKPTLGTLVQVCDGCAKAEAGLDLLAGLLDVPAGATEQAVGAGKGSNSRAEQFSAHARQVSRKACSNAVQKSRAI